MGSEMCIRDSLRSTASLRGIMPLRAIGNSCAMSWSASARWRRKKKIAAASWMKIRGGSPRPLLYRKEQPSPMNSYEYLLKTAEGAPPAGTPPAAAPPPAPAGLPAPLRRDPHYDDIVEWDTPGGHTIRHLYDPKRLAERGEELKAVSYTHLRAPRDS